MEVDRQQNESGHGTEEINKSQKDCDDLRDKSPKNETDENLQGNIDAEHVDERNSSKDFHLKEKYLHASTSRELSDKPSCSKKSHTEFASKMLRHKEERHDVQGDKNRHYRKRRNLYDQETSSSDDVDERTQDTRKRNSKIRLVHKRPEKSASSPSSSYSNRILVEIEERFHSNRSQRNANANIGDGSAARGNSNVMVIRGRYLARPPTGREVRNVPDNRRGAEGNPFVFVSRNADHADIAP